MAFGSHMDWCGRFSKYSLFVANFIIFIGAAIVFCLSLWTLIDRSFMNELLRTNIFSGVVYVLLVTSACTCLITFIGCTGAAKEVKCLLLTYFIVILLIFVSMLIGGILVYVFQETVARTMRQEMHSSMPLYGSRRAITQAWDETQERLQCCGVDTYSEWFRYGQVPESCCQEVFGGQRKLCTLYPNLQNLHAQGCYNVTTRFIREHAGYIGGSAIAVAILMIFGMIFSCTLFKTIE